MFYSYLSSRFTISANKCINHSLCVTARELCSFKTGHFSRGETKHLFIYFKQKIR